MSLGTRNNDNTLSICNFVFYKMCAGVAATKLQHKIDEESRKINRTIIFVGFNILTLYYSFPFKAYYF